MVRPQDRHLLGFAWNFKGKTRVFTQNTLPFGLASSCARFKEIASVLEAIMKCRGAPRSTLHYIDNFDRIIQGDM